MSFDKTSAIGQITNSAMEGYTAQSTLETPSFYTNPQTLISLYNALNNGTPFTIPGTTDTVNLSSILNPAIANALHAVLEQFDDIEVDLPSYGNCPVMNGSVSATLADLLENPSGTYTVPYGDSEMMSGNAADMMSLNPTFAAGDSNALAAATQALAQAFAQNPYL